METDFHLNWSSCSKLSLVTWPIIVSRGILGKNFGNFQGKNPMVILIRFVYLYIKIINPQINFKSNRHIETFCFPVQKQHPFILLIFSLPLSCLQPRWQLSGMTEKAQWSPINAFLLSFLGSPRKNTRPRVLAARSRHVAWLSSGQWNMGESVCHLQAWPLTPLVRPSMPTASPPSSM